MNEIEQIAINHKINNDKIAVFCGGKLINNPVLGEIYQFDEYGTQEFFMKCPPFGYIMKEGMSFHFDYNWLMFVIKECYQKRAINNKLLSKYEEITKELTTFSWPYPIDIVYPIVIEFIDIYNDKRN